MLTDDTLGSGTRVVNVAVLDPEKSDISDASTSYFVCGSRPVRSNCALAPVVVSVCAVPHSVSPNTR